MLLETMNINNHSPEDWNGGFGMIFPDGHHTHVLWMNLSLRLPQEKFIKTTTTNLFINWKNMLRWYRIQLQHHYNFTATSFKKRDSATWEDVHLYKIIPWTLVLLTRNEIGLEYINNSRCNKSFTMAPNKSLNPTQMLYATWYLKEKE